jgi:hypothetical protein
LIINWRQKWLPRLTQHVKVFINLLRISQVTALKSMQSLTQHRLRGTTTSIYRGQTRPCLGNERELPVSTRPDSHSSTCAIPFVTGTYQKVVADCTQDATALQKVWQETEGIQRLQIEMRGACKEPAGTGLGADNRSLYIGGPQE